MVVAIVVRSVEQRQWAGASQCTKTFNDRLIGLEFFLVARLDAGFRSIPKKDHVLSY